MLEFKQQKKQQQNIHFNLHYRDALEVKSINTVYTQPIVN